MNHVAGLLHKITPYLTNGDRAVSAVMGNQPYPARDLLITLAILVAAAWVAWRALKPLLTKK